MSYARSNLGLFSAPQFLSVGDPYEKKQQTLSRVGGKQFQTARQKPGQTSDNWGQKKRTFKPLYEAHPLGVKELYYQPGQRERQQANTARKKCLQEAGFKYSNPAPKHCGTGDYFGAFTKWEYKEPFDAVKKGDLPKVVVEVPMNIKTNPCKVGSYGANWKTLLGKEYEYAPEPVVKGAAKAARLKHEKAMLERAPFKGMTHSLDFFDTHKHVAASMIYAPHGTPTAAPPKERPGPPEDDRAPFKPSHIPHQGYNACLNAFPTYAGDNFMDVQNQQRAEAKAHRDRIEIPFKAVSQAKEQPTVPVMTHRRNLGT